MKEVECLWPNVWTSKGKLLVGDKIELSDVEADKLKKLGAVKADKSRGDKDEKEN